MRSKKDKERFLEMLSSYPIVSSVCKKTGISKATAYRWRETDKDFEEKFDKALDEGRGTTNDLAESRLISNISKGDPRSIEFWLINNDKRYHRPKKPISIEREYHVAQIIYSVVPNKKYDANLKEIITPIDP